MSRQWSRGELAAAAAGALTLLLVLAVVLVARGWWTGDGGSYAPARAIVDTDVSPLRSLFGDVLTARARVVVDPERVDPARVALAARFAPYGVRDESRRVVHGVGRAAVVEFTYELQCSVRACLPRGGGRAAAAEVVQLPAAKLTLPQRAGGAVERPVTWPAVAVQSRLTADEIGLSTPVPPARTAPPAVTWRVAPGLLGGVALAAALALLLAAGWLVASVLRHNLRHTRMRRIPAHLTPVERALRLAEHAAAHGETEESRKALERLAIELRRRRAAEQADDAERLAWSERGPSESTVAELATAVRSNGAH